MGIIFKDDERYKSTSYIGSFKIDDEEDQKELKSVKRMVAWANRSMKERGDTYRYRVCLRGRYAKIKKKIGNSFVAYNYSGNIVGGLENAKEVRCYIYQRRD